MNIPARALAILGLTLALVPIFFTAPGTAFAAIIVPVERLTQARRIEHDKTDPGWRARVDPGLNRERINIVVLVSGDNYEPSSEHARVTRTGSYTILSLDLERNQFDKITLSRDFASPEVARRITGDPAVMNPDTRIGEAFAVGGFDFSRKVIENATGLSADFMLNASDTLISKLVDALDGVDVDVPVAIALHEFYMDGIAYSARDFPAGHWHMDGITALGYAKAMAKGEYTQDGERYLRAQAVLDGVAAKLDRDAWAALKFFVFAVQSKNRAAVEMDFDAPMIFMQSATTLARHLFPAFAANGFDPDLPKPGIGLYVAPEYQGGGGGWRIPPGDMVIPIDGDPNDDPVLYWKSTREFVRGKLMP